ncbi:MAG: DNA polymerase III subunit gamma/tau [Oscillospiraceae bacterium]|nr:DNA polymerase III subunit gamma/tau [Oscillospiraceae bacterium]
MYRALYRKWRPRNFADVIGQEDIVRALRHQVEGGKVGHAYLFTGTRGTGKTTCAKILAKAVNCPNCVGGDPCGECAVCKGVEDGSLLDVVEIDAASNNGVDDVRSLREDAVYTPSMGKYKVYIVDEVHMLSTAAFNALLKIMEEPPAHLMFILATTEIHKVPVTILSRCQRYDFMRIQPEDIADRLRYVAKEESIEMTGEAALLLGQLADGAMRDALSLLDTCSGIGGIVDEELVRRVAGVTDKQYLFDISEAVSAGDVEKLVSALNDPRTRSLDTRRLCEELIFHYRNLMLGAVSKDVSLLLQVSQAEQERYLQEGSRTPVKTAAAAIRRLGDALEKMARGGNARIELELALFTMAGTVGAAEETTVFVQQPAALQPAARPAAQQIKPAASQSVSAAEESPVTEAAVQAASSAAEDTFVLWPQVVALAAQKDVPLGSFLIGSRAFRRGNRVLIDGNSMLYDYLRANERSHATLKAALQEVAGEALGIGPYTARKVEVSQNDPLEMLRRQGVDVQEI